MQALEEQLAGTALADSLKWVLEWLVHMLKKDAQAEVTLLVPISMLVPWVQRLGLMRNATLFFPLWAQAQLAPCP
jgi:hypothetical protein